MKIEVIALQEGSFSVGRDKVFVPFDLEKDELNDRARGSLLVEVQPFLIKNRNRNILVDIGLGCEREKGIPMLIDNLKKNGLSAEDIDMILMSHLHKDHSGGLKLVESFTNARIYIFQPEFEFALSQGAPSYELEVLQTLMYHDQVVWLTEEKAIIEENIQYYKTGGHCPEHIVFEIHEEDEIVFYGGDELPQYKQLIFKYVAKYDFDGEKAMQWRKNWLEKGKTENWKYLFYHDIQNPTFQF